MRLNKGNVIVLLISIFVFFFPFRKLWTEPRMLAWGDNQPFPVSSSQAFAAFFDSWQPMVRGIDNPQGVTTFLQGVLIKLFFENASLAQKFYLFLPFGLSFVFSYLFLSLVTKRVWPRILAGIFYSFNPATFGTFTGGAVGMIYVHALIPLAYFLTIEYLRNDLRKMIAAKICLLSLVLTILFYFGTVYAMLLSFPPFIYYFIKYLRQKNITGLIVNLLFSLAVFVFVFLLSFPFSYYLLGWVGNNFSSQSLNLSLWETVRSEIISSYSNNVFTDNLGLDGTYGIFGFTQILRPLGFLVLLLIFGSLPFWNKIPKNERFKLTIAASSVFFVWFFILLTSKGLTLWFFEHFNSLLVFRSPAKLILFLALPYSFLIALTLSIWKSTLNTKFYRYLFLVIFFALVVYNRPFWDGKVSLDLTKSRSNSYVISNDYQELSNWLSFERSRLGNFRTLWLPFSYEEQEIKTRFLDEGNLNFPLGLSQYLSYDGDFVSKILSLICSPANASLADAFSPYSVKYIIVDLASNVRGGCSTDGHYLFSDPELITDSFDNLPNFKSVGAFKNLAVFENTKWIPEILFVKGDVKATSEINVGNTITIDANSVHKDHGGYSVLLTPDQYKDADTLYVSEFYHSLWSASLGGRDLKHLEGQGFGNFFKLGNGEKSGGVLKIEFKGQGLRDYVIRIWYVTLGVWLVLLLASIVFLVLRR